jgi:hypothetical protein
MRARPRRRQGQLSCRFPGPEASDFLQLRRRAMRYFLDSSQAGKSRHAGPISGRGNVTRHRRDWQLWVNGDAREARGNVRQARVGDASPGRVRDPKARRGSRRAG